MDKLLEQIATTIADYREGEIQKPDAAHVLRWVKQFEAAVREPILQEMSHVLQRTYVSKASFRKFLGSVASGKKLCGESPDAFWKTTNILKIQLGGRSQREILRLFGEVLEERFGIKLAQCGSATGPFIYLDDAVFSGARVIQDLSPWIKDKSPPKATVHVIVAAYHAYGQYYADKKLQEVAVAAGKQIEINWWCSLRLEDTKYRIISSDVLRPKTIPDKADVQAYAKMLADAGYPAVFRTGSSVGGKAIFSSDDGRNLLEQNFLIEGVRIKKICPNLHEVVRPLGFHGLKTFGFGSTLVTFRNCPNNCPLVFWVDSPWYPLFPRKTNTKSSIESFMEDL
jgi:hypothetical protein